MKRFRNSACFNILDRLTFVSVSFPSIPRSELMEFPRREAFRCCSVKSCFDLLLVDRSLSLFLSVDFESPESRDLLNIMRCTSSTFSQNGQFEILQREEITSGSGTHSASQGPHRDLIDCLLSLRSEFRQTMLRRRKTQAGATTIHSLISSEVKINCADFSKNRISSENGRARQRLNSMLSRNTGPDGWANISD